MSVEQSTQVATLRRVGPPALLGMRPKLMDRVVKAADEDERVRALSLWGSLASGEGDEWSGIKFVASVADEAVSSFVEDLLHKDTDYGEAIALLHNPERGVAGGDFVSITYLQTALPMRVDWYVCPVSLGIPMYDTKLFFTKQPWTESFQSFEEILQASPSKEKNDAPQTDLAITTILDRIKAVVRGDLGVVSIDEAPAVDRLKAFTVLGKEIADLPDEFRDILPPLFSYLGVARQLGR